MKNDLGQVTRYSYLESGLHPKVFTYDEEDNPVSMTYEGQTFFFATNQVGTIFMVADERGNEIKRIINDSFGNILLDSGVSLDICLGFAAGLTDKDTELVHLGYREYDPAIGRFITPDPLGFAGGDVDVYGYCLDDPINFYDRTGLEGKSEGKEQGVPAKVIKRTGRALWEIGSLAGRSGLKLAGDAGYEAFKKISPLAHPETKNEAAKYAKKVILGETSLGQELVKSGPKIAKSTKEAWNNMIEKEKEAEKHQDEINHKVYSSKWSDLYSKNSTLRKERAKAIQDAVSPSLKGIAKAYLDTPDDRFSLILPYLKQVNKKIKSDKANK